MLAYVSHSVGKEVRGFSVDDRSGATFEVERVDLPGFGGPLVYSVRNQVLHVACRSDPLCLLEFAVDLSTGGLTIERGANLGIDTCHMSMDRSEKFLFEVGLDSGRIIVQDMRASGNDQSRGQYICSGAELSEPHSAMADPGNRNLIVACRSSGSLLSFGFDDESGALTCCPKSTCLVGRTAKPRQITFHPSGGYVYVLDESDASIGVFEYDHESGRLCRVQTITPTIRSGGALITRFGEALGGVWAADLAVSPDGRFLYATERTNSVITAFAVLAGTGLLREVEQTRTEKQPRSIAIHPNGRFLLSTGELSDQMSVYSIDGETGSLSLVGRVDVGSWAHWIEFVPSGS